MIKATLRGNIEVEYVQEENSHQNDTNYLKGGI